jgi:hypothetical protein
MTQNPFDAFSKEFLADLLEPFGTVERSFEVPGESKYIDLLFLPIGPTTRPKPKVTGSLKQVISTPSVLEIYSGSPSEDEVFTCLTKLCWLREDIVRKANRDDRKLTDNEYPRLWILAHSLSAPVRKKFAVIRKSRSIPGMYQFPNPALRTIMVSLQELPDRPDTLWMRLLGRSSTQEQAIQEVLALSLEDPRRTPLLRMLCAWKIVTIKTHPSLFNDLEATKMAYPQVFLDWEAATQQRWQDIGEQRGAQEKALTIALRLLNRRIGMLDETLESRIKQLSTIQLENLSEAVLDFSGMDDLIQWLAASNR